MIREAIKNKEIELTTFEIEKQNNQTKEKEMTSIEKEKLENKKNEELNKIKTFELQKIENQKMNRNLKLIKEQQFEKERLQNEAKVIKKSSHENEKEENKKRNEEFNKFVVPNRFSCKYVRDVTIQDGETILCGSKFIKIWEVINIGDMHWPEGCHLKYLNGADEFIDKNTKSAEFQICEVGKNIDLKIELIAPSKVGYYKIYFQVQKKKKKKDLHLVIDYLL